MIILFIFNWLFSFRSNLRGIATRSEIRMPQLWWSLLLRVKQRFQNSHSTLLLIKSCIVKWLKSDLIINFFFLYFSFFCFGWFDNWEILLAYPWCPQWLDLIRLVCLFQVWHTIHGRIFLTWIWICSSQHK